MQTKTNTYTLRNHAGACEEITPEEAKQILADAMGEGMDLAEDDWSWQGAEDLPDGVEFVRLGDGRTLFREPAGA